jgi:2'-5' RNA ligase
MLPMGHNPQVAALAAECQGWLPSDGLDRIPAEWLHLTIRRLGYCDEVTDDQLSDAVGAAGRLLRDLEPFDLSILPLAGSPGAVRFSVAPWQPLLDLYTAVAPGSSTSTNALEVYRPHVGIAYSSVQQPSTHIAAAVRAATGAANPIKVRIDEAALVRMWRAEAWYEWELVTSVLLGPEVTNS